MFGSEKRSVALVAGGLGVTLLIGLGAGVAPALVSSSGSGGSVKLEATTGRSEASAQTGISATAAPDTTVSAPAPTAAPTTTAAPRTTTTRAPRAPRTTTTVAAAAATVAPAAAVVPTLPPRRTPSSAEVQQAISGITSMVSLPLFVQITPAYVADFGNQVCTAFDQGQSFAQVKSTGLAQVAKFVVVSTAAADYAVRTAVAMYCPGHSSKLV